MEHGVLNSPPGSKEFNYEIHRLRLECQRAQEEEKYLIKKLRQSSIRNTVVIGVLSLFILCQFLFILYRQIDRTEISIDNIIKSKSEASKNNNVK